MTKSVGRILAFLPLALVIGTCAYVLGSELRHSNAFAKDLENSTVRRPSIKLTADNERADAAEILALYQGTLDSWCRGNGESYASAFTDDAFYIGFDGSITDGRRRIARWHQELFDGWLKGSCLKGSVERIVFTGRDSAVLLARGGTTFNDGPVRRPSVQTYVAVRTAMGWRFQSFQNGRIISQTPLHFAWLGLKSLFGM